MKTVTIATIKDLRVGVGLDLLGVADQFGKYWEVQYVGHYGFDGDPDVHKEQFETLEEAVTKWKQLVRDYRARANQVNRLKAFKQDWVPPIGIGGHSPNDEAVILHKAFMVATMTSQGPKTRRKRVWAIVATATTKNDTWRAQRMIVPASTVKPDEQLSKWCDKVPLAGIPKKLNFYWDAMLKAYLAGI